MGDYTASVRFERSRETLEQPYQLLDCARSERN